MSYTECVHLKKFIREEEGLKTYELLHGVFVVSGSNERRQAKILNAHCHICDRRFPFLHVCMHCTFFACHEHIRQHNKNKRHTFSMDITYGQVHCSQCGDYIYDEQIDSIARANVLQGDSLNKGVLELVWPSLRAEDKKLCGKAEKMVFDKPTHISLRGLLNLGSTSFMNCVLQAMTHLPILCDYFLSEDHQCVDTPGKCLIINLFRAFYTEEKTPLVLNEFLHFIWTQGRNLTGYEQQDGHEFFLATLDALHKHCSVTLPLQPHSSASKVFKCSCIIDQVFAGSFQRDVVCQTCSGVSTTITSVWDYSLDLTRSTTDGSLPSSLEDCLERFTGADTLESNSKIFCESCQSDQESIQKFTLRTVPVVLCFHLKRFPHLNDLEKKLSAKIKFPELLDTTSFMTKQRNDGVLHLEQPFDNKYYLLYAVISHIGTSKNAGHYISYIRRNGSFWYKCDDLVISESSIDEVLQSEGYLLFYHIVQITPVSPICLS